MAYAQQSKNHQVQILALSTGSYVIYNPENGDLFSYLKGFEQWYGKFRGCLSSNMNIHQHDSIWIFWIICLSGCSTGNG